jgi:putative restriction endonuclease
MRFWWVNQNQTFDQERRGGYMWSPKRKADGGLNHFYETMREVAPGDVIFSYCSRRLLAIGIARTYCYPCPKPAEFGKAGANWGNDGWRVDVHYAPLSRHICPSDHMAALRPLLPGKYSPLRPDGTGNQFYLTEVPASMGDCLVSLIGNEANAVVLQSKMFGAMEEAAIIEGEVLYEVEEHVSHLIAADRSVAETHKRELHDARRGTGVFRFNVSHREDHCRVTGVTNHEHLIASHIKPWRTADNLERIDGNNGLLLTPNVDHVFDKGFISFAGNGDLLVSPVADKNALHKMGIPVACDFNVGAFNRKQAQYLDYHVHEIFRRAER